MTNKPEFWILAEGDVANALDRASRNPAEAAQYLESIENMRRDIEHIRAIAFAWLRGERDAA